MNYCLNINVSRRQRVVPKGTIRDVYDGQTWEDFNGANKSDLFRKPRKYALMLNLDWFCPYEHIRNFSVGVFYLVVLKLPRHIKFRRENVIICGISSRFSHEPSTNTFVAPLVEELKNTWNDGFEYYSIISKKQKGFILAWFVLEVTTSCRKLCGFLGKKIIFRSTLVTVILTNSKMLVFQYLMTCWILLSDVYLLAKKSIMKNAWNFVVLIAAKAK